ncbi:MAG: hypothetical protein JHC95_02280 [Solirubrobacteraceae bacterium]|nr:hypothetical protein [Solirubrobacteraceae bacterium]
MQFADHRASLLAVGGAAGVSVALGVVVPALTGLNFEPWAWWIGVLGLAVFPPLVIWKAVRADDSLSLISLASGFWIVEFLAGGVFYREPRADSALTGLRNAYTATDLKVAMLIAFGAWVMLVAGYFWASWLRGLRRTRRPRLTTGEIAPVAVVLLIAGWLARIESYRRGWYFHIDATGQAAQASTLRQVVTITADLPLIATTLLAAAYYAGRARGWWLLVLILGELVWAVPSGGRFNIIALGIALIVVRYYASPKKMPVRQAAIAAVLAVFVVFPLFAFYRGADVGSTNINYQASPVENLKRAADTYVGLGPAGIIDAGYTETFRRFVGPTPLAAINRYGREPYPTTGTEAVMSWVGGFIPRTLLPTKSDPSNVANVFAQHYNIVRAQIKASYATITVPGDLYGSFGIPLMLIGMLVIGALLRGLDEWFYDRRTNPAMLAIYATFCTGLVLGIESTVAVGPIQSLRELLVYVVAVLGARELVRVVRA